MRKISEAMIISLLCVAFCLSFAVGVFGATGPIVKTQSDDFGDIRPTRNTFYLPSGILPTAVRLSGGEGTYSFAFNGEKFTYTDGMTVDVTPGKTVDANGNDVYEIYVGTKRYMLYFADSVPTMYVSTSRGLNYIASDKNVRDKNTTIYIADENGGVIYDDIANGTESEIKCRGNASFGYEKKPFQIKLGKKADLFGMGKAKTWILLANYIDCSYIRNDLAFKIADALEFDYTPESRYVNLYIDNEYYGLFELTEKVQIGSNRIEITELENENEEVNEGKDLDSLRTVTVSGDELCRDTNVKSYTYCASMTNPDDITGGYLIELDNLYAYREKCKFTTDNGNEYVIKSPECASMEQVQYIAKLFAEFEEGLYSDDGHNRIGRYYTEYADLDSLVKVYTVQEVTKNWDAYIGSVFFYKDRDADDGTVSKIFAGPVWDFDNCWGNLHRGSFFDIQTEIWAQGYGNYGGTKYKSDFGFNVMCHEEAEKLAETYFDIACRVCDDMAKSGGYIDELAEKLTSSAALDRSRWSTQRHRDFAFYTDFVSDDDSTDTAIGFLKDYIIVRSKAMRKKFSFEIPDEPEATTCVTTAATAEAVTEATVVTAETTTATVATTSSAVSTDATTGGTDEPGGCASTVGAFSSVVIAVMTVGMMAVVKKCR